MAESNQVWLTPPEIAELLRVNPDKVRGWIADGHLRAVNISDGSRPRYRVSQDDLDAFLAVRSTTKPPKRKQERRRPENVIEFY